MAPVQARRWFSPGSQLQIQRQMRRTRATGSHIARETMCWMPSCPTSHSSDETSTVNPPAFEDACSQNPLPGFQQLETFCWWRWVS
ncbi:hypothetical protein JOQ06_004723 [Pogonophryne albipinna]|uniref:Uncharacterized protein n=1 Tax=Pogonophryne albipinna TaxID=1090488 RepID=A0AAD6AP20_9TELE|nr:hypothetical protein JOQ06_004723 [Pogonophryne albipinna]